MTDETRAAYAAYAAALRHPANFSEATHRFFAQDAAINVVHPFNEQRGVQAFINAVLEPLQAAFEGLYRRDDISMTGTFGEQKWVSSTGYYVGRFAKDWINIRATGDLAYLRFGDFHRIEGSKAVESYIFLDIPEFMIACNQWPIDVGPGRHRGYTGLIQGPATRDGVIVHDVPPEDGQKSYQIVTGMLGALATADEAWRPYWHENMMWYGPGAFGSFVGIEQFASFQVPFESQFEGWSGGSANNGLTRHFTRFGEGNYTCSGGWPSVTGISVKPFLGQPPTQDRVLMRVCDWWRREGDVLIENWVFVDVPHLLLQLGYDPLP
ncbi:MAG: hypothetical protein AAF035_15095 [Pseudomonadota bacterium]